MIFERRLGRCLKTRDNFGALVGVESAGDRAVHGDTSSGVNTVPEYRCVYEGQMT